MPQEPNAMDGELPYGNNLPVSYANPPATNAAPAKPLSPRGMISCGCRDNDLAQVLRGIEAASKTKRHRTNRELLSWSLSPAVRHGQVDVVRHLLEQKGVTVDALSPLTVAVSLSTQLLQLLIDHGWDIDQHERDCGAGPGQNLLQLVCHDESLVRLCLNHGASVEQRHTDPYVSPPLLEIVGRIGTASTFTLLWSRGAQLGPRTLHRAVGSAAACSGDLERLPIRMAMVRYLVADLGLDVNALDTEGQLPNHWGTPLCYAANFGKGGVEVVQFLVDRGADPSIKDCWASTMPLVLPSFITLRFLSCYVSGGLGVKKIRDCRVSQRAERFERQDDAPMRHSRYRRHP